MNRGLWQFWVDVGGTFTDCLAKTPDGRLLRHKLLSSGATKGAAGPQSDARSIVDPLRVGDPPGYWDGCLLRLLDDQGAVCAETVVDRFDPAAGRLHLRAALPESARAAGRPQAYELHSDDLAPVAAVRYLLGLSRTDAIPPLVLRLGTTRGTNALLTRSGARTGLVTTRGFADVLLIGNQNRPRLFELQITKPQPLMSRVIEVDERVTAAGKVQRPLDPDIVRGQLRRLRASVDSLAVCLMHAYCNDRHERMVEQLAREVGFAEVSISSRTAPLIKIVSRGDTTVVDAYLNPVLRDYVETLRRQLNLGRSDLGVQVDDPPPTPPDDAPTPSLRLLTSAGGLVDADHFIGKDSILSGPAGGVVGMAAVVKAAGFSRAIGFDMGGTSTDVARWDGRFEREYETEKAGVRIVAPMMAIETVAAGGGSICRFDGVKLVVGPESAGADPGPACYGRGGPLTVTDVNLILGRILPRHFPFQLDRAAAEGKLNELVAATASASGRRYEPRELAAGLLRIANANMAKAIRNVSIAQGCDPREYTLVSFGGAGGQHACALAEELGVTRILNHPQAGVLSALGIGMAQVERRCAEGVYRPLADTPRAVRRATFSRLADRVVEETAAEGVDVRRIQLHQSLDLRYQGLDAALNIPLPDDEDWEAAFERRHRRLYGYASPGRPLEVVAARVTAAGGGENRPPPAKRMAQTSPAAPQSQTELFLDAASRDAGVFDRRTLVPGEIIAGPAVLVEQVATTVIDPGWRAEVLSDGTLLIARLVESEASVPHSLHPTDRAAVDPIDLEIFNNHFAGIAEQMGVTLQNTAASVNVKERLDFSCALFTPQGELVVNAPHIPVHLGAMGLTVRGVLADNPDLQPGDVIVTNDPGRGGSHLPDLTVVTPVHDADGRLLFFTASRAHHAEIGGVRPGSMPPSSTSLAEEGVLIRNFKIVDAGASRMEPFRELLLSGLYPTRNVEHNLADVAAQIAANHQGAADLSALIERYSAPVVIAYMRHIQRAAEQKVRAALRSMPDGARRFVDHLDDGAAIHAAVTITGETARFDFSGTDPVLPGNLNANRAIVTAVVLYVLRCLIDEDIPLNEGVLAPVDIVLPECLLNPPSNERPEDSAAVAGGNVETSQRLVDALLGALGAAAASQGTMNNLLFGDETFGYYETIGGGAGATAEGPGADAVHTHMTNTRLTDPEVLEQRFPVQVEEFAIRRGSGGTGAHRGGDGVVRRIRFLRRVEVSLLTQRRGPYPPYGQAGGSPGALGRNSLSRVGVDDQQLPALAEFTVQPGDVLSIETPGGGGYGESATAETTSRQPRDAAPADNVNEQPH